MAAELKVGIGVDPKGLDTGLGKATDQLKGFGKTVNTETKKVGASFMGMSRVMSDAAFGPGAIANNLAALGDDFKQLSSAAKESGQSLTKTFIQSLTGAGGLNLALGGLTLGLSLASFGFSAWERAFGSANKKVKEGKDDLNKYVDSLKAVDQAQVKGGQDAQKELATLNALFHVYENANAPLKTRKEAYHELNSQYPETFKNFSTEKGEVEKTKEAYDKLVASILASGRARAATELIAAKASEILVNEQKILDIKNAQVRVDNVVAGLTKAANKGEISYSQAVESQIPLLEQRKALVLSAQDLQAKNAQLTREQLQLEKVVLEQMNQGGKLIDDNKKKDNEATEARISNMKRINDQVGLGLTPINTDSIFNVDFNRFTGTLRDMSDEGIKMPALDFSAAAKSLQTARNNINAWFKETKEAVINIKPFVEGAFAGIGEALGNAFANGTNAIEAFGASVLASLGDILIHFGKLAIAAGVTSLALKAALENPFAGMGAAAIAAGIALVAVGSAVKSFSGSLSGGGGGGGGSASSSAPTAVPRGFQASAPAGYAGASAMGGNQYQFTLKGADLVASIDRTRSLNSRQGAR